MMSYTYKLRYDETPDYQYMKSLLLDIMFEKDIPQEPYFDWQEMFEEIYAEK